jgi:hypothetical protein
MKESYGEVRSKAGAWDRGKAQRSTTELKHPPAYAGGSPVRVDPSLQPALSRVRSKVKPIQIHHLAPRGHDKYLAGKLRG